MKSSSLAKWLTLRPRRSSLNARSDAASAAFHRNRVVVPFHDLSALQEEHTYAVPHLERTALEMVVPLVKHHRAFRECFDHFEVLDATQERLDSVHHRLPALIGLLSLAHAVSAVFRKERHNLIDVVAWPGSAEIV